MTESPPAGYNRRDKPLPHEFAYQVGFDITNTGMEAHTITLLKTTKQSGDPKLIVVNPRNSGFAVDEGPVICYDSIVQKMTIVKEWSMTETSMETDHIPALRIKTMKIMGAFEDAWTPADEKTSETIADLLEVTSDLTNEDVVPTVGGVNLPSSYGSIPLSTVTDAEAYTDYNLTTNDDPEGIVMDWDGIYDAMQYYTNGAKLKSLIGKIKNITLTQNRPFHSSYENKFIPKKIRYGNPHLFFGELLSVPHYTSLDQLVDKSQSFTSLAHAVCKIHVRFNEWNPDFDQARM